MPTIRQGNRIRTYGLMTGVALLVFFAALVTLSALRTTTRQTLGIPDDIPILGQTGSGLTIQLTDRDTGRLTGEIRSDRVEPLPDSRSRVEQPIAFLFLDDRRTLHVSADEGEFFVPDQGAGPESGVLSGDVRIRLFESASPVVPSQLRSGFSPHYPDVSTDQPTITFTTDEPLNFDLRVLTAETAGRIHAWGDVFELVGHGLDVVLNERRERIERITIRRGEYLYLTEQDEGAVPPSVASSTSSTSPGTPAASNGTSPIKATPTPATVPVAITPVINAYAISAAENIRVQVDEGVLTGGLLNAWVRLENNRLPEGALGPSDGSGATSPQARVRPANMLAMAAAPNVLPTPRPASRASIATSSEEAGAQVSISSEDVLSQPPAASRLGHVLTHAEPQTARGTSRSLLMTWTGPLRIVPIEPETRELRSDHLAVLITDPGGLVHANDAATGISAQAPQMHYAATTRRLRLDTGDRPLSAEILTEGTPELFPVQIVDANGRALHTTSLEADLLNKEVSLLAAGRLLDPTQPDTGLTWTEAGGLRFRTVELSSETGATTRDELEHAWFAGRAVAHNDGSRYTGDRLEFDFETSDHATLGSAWTQVGVPGADATLRLKETRAFGRASANDARNQAISASELRITFATGAEQTTPDTLTASGSVHVRDDDVDLLGEHMHAVFAPSLARSQAADSVRNSEVRIQHAFVENRVEFTRRSDAIVAFADRIELIEDGSRAVLIGNNRPAQMAQQATRMTGPRIELSDPDATAVVRGPGTIEHVEPPASPTEPPTSVRVSWTELLRFDDRMGIADCIGSAEALATTGSVSQDTLRADRILLAFTPSDPSLGPGGLAHLLPPGISISTPPESFLAPSNGTPPSEPNASERDLIQMVSLGTTQRPATIERRQFMSTAMAATDAPRTAQRIEYIDGATIIADRANGLFEVPGPGRLLLLDRQPADHEATSTDTGPDESAADHSTGSVTRVSWLDGFQYRERQSEAIARGAARITQQDLVTQDAIDIRADTILAQFEPVAASSAGSDVPSAASNTSEPDAASPITSNALRHAQANGSVSVTTISEVTSATNPSAGPEPIATGSLFADQVLFHPARDLIEALATTGNQVMFRAPNRPEPLRAARLLWNPSTGRIDVLGPRPLSIGSEANAP